MTDFLYKYLNADGRTPIQDFQWPLPTGKRPGKWLPAITGKLVACANGYHVCRASDLLGWSGETLWTVEVRGGRKNADDKVVVRQARLLKQLNWNARTQRLFACDCAERALTHAEKPDERSVNAIAVARKFATGEATSEELAAARAAARAAAWDAARAAARAAAWDAAWAAAWAAAWDAAWAAARDAARAAARAAAWDAALDAERKWQIRRLTQYIHGEL